MKEIGFEKNVFVVLEKNVECLSIKYVLEDIIVLIVYCLNILNVI